MLTIKQQQIIIRLGIYALLDSAGLSRPEEVKIDQTVEKIIESLKEVEKIIAELKPCDCDFNGQNPALICKTKKPSKYCRPIKNVMYYKHANKIWGQGEISK